MVETSVRSSLTLPHMGEPSKYGPRDTKAHRKSHKTIPYGSDCNLYKTIVAIAHYKGWAVGHFLKHLGYTSSSVHGTWLSKSRCPAKVTLLVSGWLSEQKLVATYSQKTAGMSQNVSIQKAGAPEKTVEIQHEFVPVSVPLTMQNVLDLIILCATNGEEQLIIPLANLLGDKNVFLNED